MNLVYIKCSYDFLQISGFFRKLKRYVGHFRIEAQDVNDSYNGIVTISFYTDKVKIQEGKSRQVEIEAKENARGSWYFTRITHYDL